MKQDTYFSLISELALGFIGSLEYTKVLNILLDCYKRKGIVYTMGCGGSASTATHFAADLYTSLSARKEAEEKAKKIFPNTIAAVDDQLLKL